MFLDNSLAFGGPNLFIEDPSLQTSNFMHLGCKLGVKGFGFLFFCQEALVVLVVCNDRGMSVADDFSKVCAWMRTSSAVSSGS